MATKKKTARVSKRPRRALARKATKELWKEEAGARFLQRPLLRELDSSEDRVEVAAAAPAMTGDAALAARDRLAALEGARQPAAAFSGLTAPVAGTRNWTQLGPLVIPLGQTYTNARVNVSGRVTAIAIDPTDPQTIYIGAAQGGVWKTTNGGVTWAPLSDNEASLAIGALVLDPNNPQIIYAGTGEGNFSGDSYYGLGILKSTDGGASWSLLGLSSFAGKRFCRLAIPAANSALLLAAVAASPGGAGIFRSLDGGTNWTQLGAANGLPTSHATDVVFDPSNGNIAYAAFLGNGIYKTTNAMAASPTWTKLAGGLPTTQLGRIVLAVSPSSPNTLYTLIGNISTDRINRFLVSTNRGSSWTTIPLPGGNIGQQSFYNIHVTVDPTTPDIVYLCGISLWKAVRTGASWSIQEIGGGIHPDHHYSAVHPTDPLTIYAGNDGGIYKSSNGGQTWDDSINSGLCIAQFEFIDDHPHSGAPVFGGTQDNGTEMYRNSPVFYHADDGDGGCCLVNENDPKQVLSTYYGASPKVSIQGGEFNTWFEKWDGIDGDSLFYPPVVSCLTDPNRIAVGTDRLNISANQGTDGWPVKIPANGGMGEVSAIAFVTPTLLYAANTEGDVFKVNGGSATKISQPPLPASYVWDIAALPGDTTQIILVMSGFGIPHVWRGAVPASGSAAWTNISSNLPDIPVNALVIDPDDVNTLYIGTDIGVYRTTDAGASWSRFSNGLPNCAVFDLKLNQATRVLRAATHGRGMWEIPLDVPSTPAVDLYLRDHLMDTARLLPTPFAVAAWNDPTQHVTLGMDLHWWMSADIKVDALEGMPPSYQMPVSQVDYVRYEANLVHRNPQRGRVNRVYVQVHNRGFQPAANVRVKILFTNASVGVADLPADFWTAFPGDSTDTSNWKPIGAAQTIASLPPGPPAILEWDWTPPLDAAPHSCILAVIDSTSDSIPAANKVLQLGVLIPNEKRVAMKNLHVIDPVTSPAAVVRFAAPSARKQTIRVVPHAPSSPKMNLTFDTATAGKVKAVAGFRKESLPAASSRLAATVTRPGWKISKQSFSLDRGQTGELELTIPKAGVEAVITAKAGASFSIVQYEGDQIVGGSTFVVRG